MATLEKIRGKAGLLVIVIGVALLAFIIGDLLNSGQTYFRLSTNNVATVNGENITYEQYLKRVNDLTEYMKMQYNQSSLPKEATAQVNESAYQSLITEILMADASDKIGLAVSKEELNDLLQGEHISPIIQQMFTDPQTGAFDKTMLLGFLQNILSPERANSSPQLSQYRTLWLYLEDMIAQQRLISNYNMLLTKAVMPNKLDIQFAYDGGKESVDFAYVMQPYSSIADSTIQISDSEIKTLYNKKKESFKQDEKRAVKYIYVDIVPSESDYKEVETKINELKDEFATTTEIAEIVNLNSDNQYEDAFIAIKALPATLQEFSKESVGAVTDPALDENVYKMNRIVAKTIAPDSVKIRYIVLPQDAEQRADSLLNVINKGGDFAALAAQYSADKNTASRGGEVGWITEIAALRGVGADFKNAAFNAKGDETIKLKTDYALLLLQVLDRTKNVEKVKIAEIAMEVSPSSKTYTDLYNGLNQYIAKNGDLKNFDANAAAAGFQIREELELDARAASLGAIRDGRQVVRWAFNNEPGQISEIIEADDKFVALGVIGVFEAGYAPLAQVKTSLKQELQKDKKAELIVKDLVSKNLTSLDAYVQAVSEKADTAKFVTFNTRRISGLGDEPALCGVAPFVNPGQLTGPIKGNNGVFAISVIAKTPSEKEFNAAEEQKRLESEFGYSSMYQILDILRNGVEIKDNSARFF